MNTQPNRSVSDLLAGLPKPKNTRRPVGLRRILFVGNSFIFYNCGAHTMVGDLAKANGFKITTTLVAIGGAGLYWHDVKSYLRPHGLRSYEIASDGTNEVRFIEYQDGKIFDAVVLEDSSQGPIHPGLNALFRESLARHVRSVREAGAEPYLMMTWAYRDKPEMIRALAHATIEAADEQNISVIPVGLAFARAAQCRPELALIRSDNRHPTVAGTYLEAAVFFASLTGINPQGTDYVGRFDDLIVKAQDALFLQKIAWDTVSTFNDWR